VSIHKSGNPDTWSTNEIRAGMCPAGPWVQAADYDTLRAELAEVRGLLSLALDREAAWQERAKDAEADIAQAVDHAAVGWRHANDHRTRADAAKRDARRYRFLRELSEAKLPIIAAWGASGDAEYLDAAIDAALSGTVKQGEGE
jgi:hypothetical protein